MHSLLVCCLSLLLIPAVTSSLSFLPCPHNQCSSGFRFINTQCYCGSTPIGNTTTISDLSLSPGHQVRFLISDSPALDQESSHRSQQQRNIVTSFNKLQPTAICLNITHPSSSIQSLQGTVSIDGFGVLTVPWSGCVSSEVHSSLQSFDVGCSIKEVFKSKKNVSNDGNVTQLSNDNDNSMCTIKLDFLFFGYTLPSLPTKNPVEEYYFVGRMERSFSHCTTLSKAVLIPGTCDYICWDFLSVSKSTRGNSLTFTQSPIGHCDCGRYVTLYLLLSNNGNFASGRNQLPEFSITSVREGVDTQNIMIQVEFISQKCTFKYSVTAGNVLGASAPKPGSTSSHLTTGLIHDAHSSVLGIVFCALLIAGGFGLFVRGKYQQYLRNATAKIYLCKEEQSGYFHARNVDYHNPNEVYTAA